jgi:hypothetical protein
VIFPDGPAGDYDMRTLQISDGVKDIIDRHVAGGAAVSEADFVEAAVRRYAEELDGDMDALIASAEEGIADIAAGNYITIASQADADEFWADMVIELTPWSRGCGLRRPGQPTSVARTLLSRERDLSDYRQSVGPDSRASVAE